MLRRKLPTRHRKRRVVIVFVLLLMLGMLGASGYTLWSHQRATRMAQSAAVQTSKQQISTNPLPITTPVLSDDEALGIAAGSSLPTLSSAQLDARFQAIQAMGARWLRFDIDWSLVQPDNSHTYNWVPIDRIIDAAAAHHLSVLPILDYTPKWARFSGCTSSQCAPADPSQFAAFAASAAQRYSPRGVHYWEIWNEPNNRSFWLPAANPDQYVQLLNRTYTALHAADAQAYVITGGLSPQATANGAYSPYDFLSAVYNSGGRSYFDAVADHPYTFPLLPVANADDAWTQMAAQTHSLRSLMLANGDGDKKIWITEFGSPTGGPGPVATISNPNLEAHPYVVDEALQAKILTDALQLYRSYTWAGPFFYYTYLDPGTDPSTNENFFGLVTVTGTQKPAFAVFVGAAKQSEP